MVLKVDRLETHDRYKHFMQDQSEGLAKGAETCLKTNPIALAIQQKSPYVYLFAHPRTADDGVTKRMLWQARISRPTPQTNSYLFRAISNSDLIEICWLLPPREMWDQYESGKITASELTLWSIDQFKHYRRALAAPHPEDLSDEKGRQIYKEVIQSLKPKPKFKMI